MCCGRLKILWVSKSVGSGFFLLILYIISLSWYNWNTVAIGIKQQQTNKPPTRETRALSIRLPCSVREAISSRDSLWGACTSWAHPEGPGKFYFLCFPVCLLGFLCPSNIYDHIRGGPISRLQASLAEGWEFESHRVEAITYKIATWHSALIG